MEVCDVCSNSDLRVTDAKVIKENILPHRLPYDRDSLAFVKNLIAVFKRITKLKCLTLLSPNCSLTPIPLLRISPNTKLKSSNSAVRRFSAHQFRCTTFPVPTPIHPSNTSSRAIRSMPPSILQSPKPNYYCSHQAHQASLITNITHCSLCVCIFLLAWH